MCTRVSLLQGQAQMRNDLTIYDQIADQWWSEEVRWIRILRNLAKGRLSWFDQALDWRGKEVLDLGCAGGFMSDEIAQRGARVTGIDPAQKAIEIAIRHAESKQLSIRYDAGVGEKLPYADHTFDIVICVDVLEHVSDLNKVINEIVRVLKPGGYLAYDTINRNPLAQFATITLAEDILGILPRGTHDPKLFIKPSELKAVMEKAGLIVEPIVGLGPNDIDMRLDPTFGRISVTGIIYMGLARLSGEGQC
jgi:2-polyprenyl-6-hydroxyphenyl methylase/3-demethylubiquinone-9 3-methyltransferase